MRQITSFFNIYYEVFFIYIKKNKINNSHDIYRVEFISSVVLVEVKSHVRYIFIQIIVFKRDGHLLSRERLTRSFGPYQSEEIVL